MSLDPRFILATNLQEFFVNDNTGLPLSNGFVYFYQDINRTNPKPVYEISGTPPNYSYNALPNPINLGSAGQVVDGNGNDVLIYYFPYEGTPTNSDGNIDLYYIVVTDMSGNVIFTREGFPNYSSSAVITNENVTNYIPNGQFLAHNEIFNTSVTPPLLVAPTSTFNYGIYTTKVIEVAPGGWTWEVTNGSTAVDVITWPRTTGVTQTPAGSPRYSFEVDRTTGQTNTIADLRITFDDVNKFATQTMTFLFTGYSLSGSELSGITVNQINYYGAGGTTTTDVQIGNDITFLNGLGNAQQFAINITFGDNSGDNVDANGDDDFIQLAIRFPTSSSALFNIAITDAMLVLGTFAADAISFPVTTTNEFMEGALAGSIPVPAYTNYNLYLPIILGLNGFQYDNSQIGKIEGYPQTPYSGNLLKCDGTTYLTSAFSSLGIPYSRLQAYLAQNSAGYAIPLYGTGSSFVTTLIENAATNNIFFTTNTASISLTAPNANTSGFTISAIHSTGSNATYGYTTAVTNDNASGNAVLFLGEVIGTVTAPTAGTSGMSFTIIDNQTDNHAIFYFDAVAASALANPSAAGKYFTFSSTTTTYYMWFQITNETDPAPGGTGIKVNLQAGNTYQDVAIIIAAAASAAQQSLIVTGVVTQNAYWSFTTPNSDNYYVWYNISNGGVDPKPAGFTMGIQVPITTNTAAAVATATVAAINSTYFGVPNYQGVFFRGYDPNKIWDVGSAYRFGATPLVFGNNLGTFELDLFRSHVHTGTGTYGGNVSPSVSPDGHTIAFDANTPGPLTATMTTPATGGSETRPVNAVLQYYIRY